MEGYGIWKNGEGYPDPTAYATLKKEEDEEKRKQRKSRTRFRRRARSSRK